MFMIFCWDTYYPRGGFNDYQTSMADIQACREYIVQNCPRNDHYMIVAGTHIVERGNIPELVRQISQNQT